MKKKPSYPLSLFLIILCISLVQYSCKKKDNDEQNAPPVIQSITSTPNTSVCERLPSGEDVTVTVTATDPNQDDLSYLWQADGGSFSGLTNQSSITWQSPLNPSPMTYKITATVSDGAETKSTTIDVYVGKVTPGIGAIPNNVYFGSDETEFQMIIFNTGDGELKWGTYFEEATWLKVNPDSGKINYPSDTFYITLSVDRSGLNPDSYSEDFRLANRDDLNNFVTISVAMDVPDTASLIGYTYYANTTIPAPGVVVKVCENSSSSGSDAYYSIEKVPTGSQSIIASKEGFDTFSSNIQIGLGTNEYNVELTSAQYTHILFGSIHDYITGEPISYASVIVLNPDGTESNLRTQSTSSGYYELPTVPQGGRTIKFTHDIYETAEIDIFMVNSDYELNIEMNSCLAFVSTENFTLLNPVNINIVGNSSRGGGSDIIYHGHCWSEYENPTIYDYKTNLGGTNSLGAYTSEVSFLKENTQYYIRAFTVNDNGTYYGENVIVNTTSFPDCGTIDYDGQIYQTVMIGEQCWMKENLNFQTTSGSHCYKNLQSNCEIYGRLYSWNTMMNGESSSNQVPSGVQGICPYGWHIPSDAEWSILVDFLGGLNFAGGKMKSIGTSLWDDPNTGANNSSGFSALPGGSMDLWNAFSFLGRYGFFWASTESSTTLATYYNLKYNELKVTRWGSNKEDGRTVRCVID